MQCGQLQPKLLCAIVVMCARRCSFLRPSVEAEVEVHGKMPPIKVKFEIPYFTVSGIQV
jgi:hypothetical protein